MSQPVDGQFTIRLRNDTAPGTPLDRYTVRLGADICTGYFTSFELTGVTITGATNFPATDVYFFIGSVNFDMGHCVSSVRLPGGQQAPNGRGMIVPLEGVNFYHDFNNPHILRANRSPCDINFYVLNQDGTNAVFTNIVLYFTLR